MLLVFFCFSQTAVQILIDASFLSTTNFNNVMVRGCQLLNINCQILRIDREGMIDDVILHSVWCHLCKKYLWHNISYRSFEETFDVNSKIAQTMRNIYKFIVGKSSLQLNSKLWRISGRFHTLIWKPGDTVQNLESPRLSRRVDITVVSFYHQYIFITRHMKNWCHFVFYNNKSSKKSNCW